MLILLAPSVYLILMRQPSEHIIFMLIGQDARVLNLKSSHLLNSAAVTCTVILNGRSVMILSLVD